MAGLEDIPKKQFFETPEGYFDQLPAKIQSRIETKKDASVKMLRVRLVAGFAAAMFFVASVVMYSLYPSAESSAEAMVASIETEQLVEYLLETGVGTDELIENIDFTPQELDNIEDEVYDLDSDDIENF